MIVYLDQVQPVPLSCAVIVRDVREHVVQPVAPHGYRLFERAFRDQVAEYDKLCAVVEIKFAASRYGQCSGRIDSQVIVNKIGLFGGQDSVLRNEFLFEQYNVLAVGFQFNPLGVPVGAELDIVVYQNWRILVVWIDGYFDKKVKAVMFQYFHVTDGVFCIRITVQVDAEIRFGSFPEHDLVYFQVFLVRVVNHDARGRAAYGRENGIEPHGVGRKGKFIRWVIRKLVVAGCEKCCQ